MADKRFWFGVTVTVAWIGFGGYMLAANPAPKDLNSWGDFFAGFFSPVAFLWLVLGYLQQGEELRSSTDALRLQAEELKHSVEQQSRLVEISREQLQRERELYLEEQRLRIETAHPKFILDQNGSYRQNDKVYYRINLRNVGATATGVLLTYDPPIESFNPKNKVGDLDRGQSKLLDVGCTKNFSTKLRLAFFDANAQPGTVEFDLQGGPGQALEIGDPRRLK